MNWAATGVLRRADNAVLRWQARLDAGSADRTIPWIISGLLLITLAAMAIGRAHAFEAGDELALYTRSAWLINRSESPILNPAGDHLLRLNGSLAFYPIAFAVRWLPHARGLLALQALALASGVFPIWALCRKVLLLRSGASMVMTLAYALNPSVSLLGLSDFSPVAFALPLLLGAFYYGLTGSRWRFVLCVLATMACSIELTLAVAGLGILLVVEGRRRFGIGTSVLALVWLLGAAVFFDVGSVPGSVLHVDNYASLGDSSFSVLTGALTDPVGVIGSLVSERSLRVAVFLLVPLALLPMLALRFLLPVLPVQIFYLLSEAPEEMLRGHAAVPFTAFAVLATAHALAGLGIESIDRVAVNPKLIGALLLGTVLFFLVDSVSSPYRSPWQIGVRDQVDESRLDAVEQILAEEAVLGEHEPIRAAATVATELAVRPIVYRLAEGEIPTERSSAANGVRTIVIDAALVPGWSRRDRLELTVDLVGIGYRKDFDENGIVVYRWNR